MGTGRWSSCIVALLLAAWSPAAFAQAMAVPAPGYGGVQPGAPETREPKPCVTGDASAPSPPPQEGVLFPHTGKIFTLPPAEPEMNSQAMETCLPPPPVRPPDPDIFGYSAVPLGEKSVTPKWESVRDLSLDGGRGDWKELVDQAPQLSSRDPLPIVNQWVNWHVRFVDDANGDRWSSAASTLSLGRGDCEDFAIAKMALLKRFGISQDEMFLVLLRERNRPVDHAVLAVRRGTAMYVLDSRTDKILKADQIADYSPTFSFSGPFAWIYGRALGINDRRR